MGAYQMTNHHLQLIPGGLSDLGSGVSASNAPKWAERKMLSESQESWRREVEQRLEELIRLPAGWDGYQGIPVSFSNAVFALRMLESTCRSVTPSPQIVPGVSGDLQIEWHTLSGDIELHVRAPNNVHAWRSLSDLGEDGEELHLTNNFFEIANWVKQLTEPSLAAISAAA